VNLRRLGHPRRSIRDRRGLEGRTGDQRDAFCIAAWLARADRGGTLAGLLKPDLSLAERAVAQIEGWILGVPGLIPGGRAARRFRHRRGRRGLRS
jgi:hypothetical protein